jgi:hypothetical protein
MRTTWLLYDILYLLSPKDPLNLWHMCLFDSKHEIVYRKLWLIDLACLFGHETDSAENQPEWHWAGCRLLFGKFRPDHVVQSRPQQFCEVFQSSMIHVFPSTIMRNVTTPQCPDKSNFPHYYNVKSEDFCRRRPPPRTSCANLPDVTGVLHIRFLTQIRSPAAYIPNYRPTGEKELLDEPRTVVRNKPTRPSVRGHTENRGN